MKRSSEARKPACLFCKNDLGLFRRITRRRFCSAQHEEGFAIQFQKLAVERLRNADAPVRTSVLVQAAVVNSDNRPEEDGALLAISVAANAA